MLNFSRQPRKVANKDAERELGFGKSITIEGRMMNPDGTFNVVRQYTSIWDNAYFNLVSLHWGLFFGAVLLFFILMNALFAFVYCLVGIEQLNGTVQGSFFDEFSQAYFFSSQTLTTVGYGFVSPNSLITNILASFESFLGFLFFALVSGLLYGRFSRQRAKIVFSEHMIVAPYKDISGLMFRMGNARSSEIIEAEAQIILAINQRDDKGAEYRRFFNLALEINKVSFFSLSWTIVHPLDDKSPIFGFNAEDLISGNAEFLILVKGMDEANHNSVHARRSYTANEVIWNAKFKPVISRTPDGRPLVLNREIGAYEVL